MPTDPNYDPELDPTPEDGEITLHDEVLIRIAEAEALQAESFNFWRAVLLDTLYRLRDEGVEGDTHLFHPEPPPPEVSEWDEQGFSQDVSNHCVRYKHIHETALRWAESNDRILEYGASFMRRQWYMLPIDRFDDNDEFQQRYLENATCRPHVPFLRGRSGFINKPVFANIEATERAGHVFYSGSEPIEDHHQPITGTSMSALKENIEGLFVARFAPGGPGYEGFLRTAANAVFEMDRNNRAKWEGYREAPSQLRFQRELELELARANPDF